MSNSFLPHGLQCTRLPRPPISHRVCSNSCPLSWWYYNHLILCCPLLLLPSIFPSIRVFASGIDWSFSFSSSPSSEYSGLISFRVDWFDLLEVQEILRHLLQHHSWKASILWCTYCMPALPSLLNVRCLIYLLTFSYYMWLCSPL